jgi:hypothetical protein
MYNFSVPKNFWLRQTLLFKASKEIALTKNALLKKNSLYIFICPYRLEMNVIYNAYYIKHVCKHVN